MKQNLPSQIELRFDNRFTRSLPADQEERNFRRQVIGACYSRVLPTKVAAPQLLSYSREVAHLIGLSDQSVKSIEFAEVFAGNRVLEGMDPFAMCYGGHQFGNWAGQLGDGRAINLGEVVNANNEHWTLQLKGAGPTPYSRMGDGLAVLRSSIREYLCSEAMHHLGVPTTRALCIVTTGEQVERDMFYNGNPQMEPGAIVCRVAQSFLRFGNYQVFMARSDNENLRKLVDYTIESDFPHLGKPSPEVYLQWFSEICSRTLDLVVHWMRVGFVHGVMNTDNMSILGQTIDYGPYGWLENYDPSWTPNTTDSHGRRYCYGQQPQIALWNLVQFAYSIVPFVEDSKLLENVLQQFGPSYQSKWNAMMANKLGLPAFQSGTDGGLIEDLLKILEEVETDMTIFYRQLAKINLCNGSVSEVGHESHIDQWIRTLSGAYYDWTSVSDEFKSRLIDWLERYRNRIQQAGVTNEERTARMNSINPKFVLRNYLAQLAIDRAEQGDGSLVDELLEVLRRPYDEQPAFEKWSEKRPEWARDRPGCSMLSCSS